MTIPRRMAAVLTAALAGAVLCVPAAHAWESHHHKWGEGKETRRFDYVNGTHGGMINLTGCRTNASRGFRHARIEFWKHVRFQPDARISSWKNECNTDGIDAAAGRGTYYFRLDDLVYGDLLTIKKLTVI